MSVVVADQVSSDVRLEIAHVLFIDIVGYSKLLTNEQRERLQELNRIVRETGQFREAEAAGKLIRIPAGDGMVLAFFTSPDAPVRCAVAISRVLRETTHLPLRMGIHSGPVELVQDVSDKPNLAGAGVNIAQRVMDCGDAGHVLLSKRVADDLAQYSEWQPYIHELGTVEVKHGVKLEVVNFYNHEAGNPTLPAKLKLAARKRTTRKWTIAAAVALIATVSFFFFRIGLSGRAGGTPIPTANKSIAVLPFENLSTEKENAFFADGVQNEILTNLAKIADLKVISRASVLIYKPGSVRNLREIGQQLGVAHVLEGSVQRAGAKVRVSAQLIDARTDKHIWAGTYDRELADVFSIETELAQAIAGELQAKLTTTEKAAIEEIPTQDLAAYDFYVHAVSIIYNAQVPTSEDLVDLSEAVDLLDKAVARDPNFFLAYCQLAFVHDLIYQQEKDRTPARLALAQSAIDNAFRLRPDSGEAHLALAWHLYWGHSDYERARAEVTVAQQSLPNNPRVYELVGLIDRREGRWADAIRNLDRAGELDPRNLPYQITLATTYLWLHDYDQEAKTLDRIIVIQPDRRLPRILRPDIEIDRRADTGPFRAVIEKILTDEPGSEKDMAGHRLRLALLDRDLDTAANLAAALSDDFHVGLVARLKGDETSARAAFMKTRAQLEEQLRIHPDDIGLLSDLGLVDAALGRKEEALSEGRRALELAPTAPEAMTGPSNNEGSIAQSFAMICAWAGERDLALEQLELLTKNPGGPHYGFLRLSPMWDPLRGDPRFEKIVASLAPKNAASPTK